MLPRRLADTSGTGGLLRAARNRAASISAARRRLAFPFRTRRTPAISSTVASSRSILTFYLLRRSRELDRSCPRERTRSLSVFHDLVSGRLGRDTFQHISGLGHEPLFVQRLN